MERYEYMKLPFDIACQEIIDEYNLTDISHNGKVYIHFWKGIYGLPQSGRNTHEGLKNHLEKHRYQPVKYTPGLCTHKSRTTSFTLIF